jgi:hypothetical protein
MADLAQRVSFLESSRNSDDGWGYFPGKQSRLEPTIYAMRALGPQHPAYAPALAFVESAQEKDGGFRPGADIPGSTWVTALAIPLLAQAKRTKAWERAGNWLVETSGAENNWTQRLLHLLGKIPIDQNPRLRGWPWRPGNNSWVEPTAHALVALRHLDGAVPEAAIRYRRDQAVALLRDRRCLDLGWNYGNKRVLDEVLPSYPETTGIALVGLAAASGADAAELAAAQKILAASKGAYAQAWLTVGLRLNKVTVPFAPNHGVHPSRNLALTSLEILAAQDTPAW